MGTWRSRAVECMSSVRVYLFVCPCLSVWLSVSIFLAARVYIFNIVLAARVYCLGVSIFRKIHGVSVRACPCLSVSIFGKLVSIRVYLWRIRVYPCLSVSIRVYLSIRVYPCLSFN